MQCKMLSILLCFSFLLCTIANVTSQNQLEIEQQIGALKAKQSLIESHLQRQLERLEAKLRDERLKNMELKEKLTLEIKRNDDFQRRLIAEVVRADSLEKQLNAAIKCDSSYAGSESTYIEQNQKVNQNSYSHKGKYKTRISRQVQQPAFTAYLSTTVNLGEGQAIPFDVAITNEGNGFNVYSNAFTCPEAGVYLFMFFLGDSKAGIELQAFLEINSVNQVDAAVQPYADGYAVQGGNAAVARLNTGDVVMVKARGNTEARGSSTIRTTTFSGVFLYP